MAVRATGHLVSRSAAVGQRRCRRVGLAVRMAVRHAPADRLIRRFPRALRSRSATSASPWSSHAWRLASRICAVGLPRFPVHKDRRIAGDGVEEGSGLDVSHRLVVKHPAGWALLHVGDGKQRHARKRGHLPQHCLRGASCLLLRNHGHIMPLESRARRPLLCKDQDCCRLTSAAGEDLLVSSPSVSLQRLGSPGLAVRMAVLLGSAAAHSDQVDEREQLAVDAVRSYTAALKRIRDRLFAAYPDLTGLSDLLAAVRSTRVLPQEGQSSTRIDYSVHGAGCRMTDEQGTEVDVDLIDGVEAFDGWRVHAFLEGHEGESLSVDELHAACSRLAGWAELRELQAHRWYAL